MGAADLHPPASSEGAAADADLDQIAERLGWTPWGRLQYLLDMLEFEELAHRARRVPAEK